MADPAPPPKKKKKKRRPSDAAVAPAPEQVVGGLTVGREVLPGLTVARWEERLAVFLGTFFLMVILTQSIPQGANWGSWNDQSRFATIQALVEEGTFAIDATRFGWWTGDKAFVGEHFYSTKPPLLSVAGAAIYYPLHRVMGWSYFNETQAPWIYYTVTLLLVGLPMAAIATLFYDTLGMFKLSLRWRIIGVISLVLGSLYLPYSTVFQNHTVAGLAGFYSFVLFLRTSQGLGPALRNLALAGLMIGIALATDIVGGAPFLAGALGWCLARALSEPGVMGLLLPFLGGLGLPIGLHLLFNLQITGDFSPIYSKGETYRLTNVKGIYGEVLERRGYFATLFDPYRWRYIVNSLVGIRGVFLYTPVLAFGFWIGWRLLRQGWATVLELEPARIKPLTWWLAGFLGMTTLTWVYLLLRTENYGGTSYGSRYFIPPMTVLLCLAALVHSPLGTLRARGWYAEALRVSLVFAVVGLFYPWGVVSPNPTNFSLVANLQAQAEGVYLQLLRGAGLI